MQQRRAPTGCSSSASVMWQAPDILFSRRYDAKMSQSSATAAVHD
jgi:hypothetical protein